MALVGVMARTKQTAKKSSNLPRKNVGGKALKKVKVEASKTIARKTRSSIEAGRLLVTTADDWTQDACSLFNASPNQDFIPYQLPVCQACDAVLGCAHACLTDHLVPCMNHRT